MNTASISYRYRYLSITHYDGDIGAWKVYQRRGRQLTTTIESMKSWHKFYKLGLKHTEADRNYHIICFIDRAIFCFDSHSSR
ncbi:hypothetical protein IEQ34_006709 [Dendrobium chrysotoxum]|uniref:Uncharacterized protein n=1 Tax=Dendrobium chrysotoxum TaxID=161865 RepID=A0AAV7H8X8_DENCH|nr:hypothetical protein IEQ34_006709 [Dendrobium chrysotoxum]